MRLAVTMCWTYLRRRRAHRRRRLAARTEAVKAIAATVESLLYVSECLNAANLALARQVLEEAEASGDEARIQRASAAVLQGEADAFARFRERWEHAEESSPEG